MPEYDCSIRGHLSLANSSIQVTSFPVLWQCYDTSGNDSGTQDLVPGHQPTRAQDQTVPPGRGQ